jgi:iron(III) transport system substrate-binding protein
VAGVWGSRAAAVVLLSACILGLRVLWPPRRDTLVIYSAMGPSGPLVAAFERDTRIRVTYVNMNGDALLARIYAEGRHPGWDLAWFVGDAAAAELDRSGLLRSFPDAFAAGASAAAWTPAARAMLPADRAWLPTGLVIAGVFATLRNAPAPSPSWSALLSRSAWSIRERPAPRFRCCPG